MAGFSGFGSVLSLSNDASTPVYTKIAGITNIAGPGLSMSPVETTSMDSTDGFREFVAGLKDPGEIGLSLVFDPAAATHKDATGGLLDEYTTGATSGYKLTFSDTGTTEWTFDAMVTNFEPTAPMDGALTADVSIKITGAPTLA